MTKSLLILCSSVACILLLLLHSTAAIPRPQPQAAIVPAEAAAVEDLETGAAVESEKDDLQGSASYGYGYYSYPYLSGGYYGGGYNPYYGGGYYGLGYPYYGGYYGGYHGHYGHYW